MDPLGAIPDSRECVKLDDLISWQKTWEITDYSSSNIRQEAEKFVQNGKNSDSTVNTNHDAASGPEFESADRGTPTTKQEGESPILGTGESKMEATGDAEEQEIDSSPQKTSAILVTAQEGESPNLETSKSKTEAAGDPKNQEINSSPQKAPDAKISEGDITTPSPNTMDTTGQDIQSATNGSPNEEDLSTDLQFPCNESLNSIIYLWNGDITKLSVQAIILPVYEALSKSSHLYANLMYTAGPRLLNDCKMLTGLRTSEIRVHHGYDLPARYAIHSVEPRFNPKYHSAADTALNICYRSSLQLCAEKELRTIAISPLHITRKGFPLIEGSSIALRTIRKCLEVLESKFDAVVIVTDPTVAEAYSKLFPAYFPRSEVEGRVYSKLLPKMISCNQWGEIVKEERAIRIADITEIKPSPPEVEGSEVNDDEVAIDQTMAPRAFSQMSGDHDKKRKFLLTHTTNQQNLQAQERIYVRLLRIARNEKFSKFPASRAIKVSGYDVTGNRVIVIIGRHLVFSEMDPERFLLYLILTFDPVVNEPYTIVYFHTETMDYNRPSTEYLRKLYNTLDRRCKENLARLCIVHMNRMMRFRTWVHMSFSASEIRDRVVNVQSIPELYKIVNPNQIDVPPFILNYDIKMNPQAYNTSPRRSPTNNQRPRDSDFNRIMPTSL